MAFTFGAATSDDMTIASTLDIGSSSGHIWMGWLYPTTLTAGRCPCGWSTNTRYQIHTTTSELDFRFDRTTDTLQRTTDLGMVVNVWQFIAVARSALSGTPAIRCWIGTGELPPREVAITVVTVGSGAIGSSTASTIGNSTSTATVAWQGDIGQVTEVYFTPSVITPLIGEAAGTITQAEADYFHQNVVIPHWNGEPKPHFMRGTTQQILLWDLESIKPMLYSLQGGSAQRLGPEEIVTSRPWSENRQPRGILDAWPSRNQSATY